VPGESKENAEETASKRVQLTSNGEKGLEKERSTGLKGRKKAFKNPTDDGAKES